MLARRGIGNSVFTRRIQYKFDINDEWIDYECPTANNREGLTITLANKGDKVLFQNLDNNFSYDYSNNYFRFEMTGKIYARGHINSLINYTNSLGTTSNGGFAYLFQNNDALLSMPLMDDIILYNYHGCCRFMFDSCINLRETNTTINAISTTGVSLFSNMFRYCNNIIKTPIINITINSTNSNIMENMFYYCINLKEFRGKFNLNGNILPSQAFAGMFIGCVNLVVPPSIIPGKIALSYACNQMFNNCVSLPYIPKIELEILSGNQCFYFMFADCREIKEIKEPPVIKEMYGTYECSCMFQRCYKLKNAFELPATITQPWCYQNMFNGCTNLISGCSILPANHLANYAYMYMFQNCTNLEQAPEICAETWDTQSMVQMFTNDNKINKIKVHFTEWGPEANTSLWVQNVSTSGEFICPSALPEVRGNNNIPNNWIITRF